ncbi:hypothetical protein J0H58_29145 [bacterium]|nr:hypothetical protein [bacterium]
MRPALVALLLALPATASPLRQNEATIAGGDVVSDGHGISGMSLWVRRGEPAVGFGLSKAGVRFEHGYVLVLKGDPGRTSPADWGGTAKSDGTTAVYNGHVTIGRRASVDYSVTPTSEALRVNGREYDLAKGRVFLIDLTRDVPTVQQVRAELAAPVNPTTTEQVDTIARDHLRRMKWLPATAAFFR